MNVGPDASVVRPSISLSLLARAISARKVETEIPRASSWCIVWADIVAVPPPRGSISVCLTAVRVMGHEADEFEKGGVD